MILFLRGQQLNLDILSYQPVSKERNPLLYGQQKQNVSGTIITVLTIASLKYEKKTTKTQKGLQHYHW